MAIKSLDDNEPKLKNALPQQIFTKTALEPGVLKSVVDEINKIDPQKFNDHDLIGRVYESFLQAFSINADKEEGEFYTPAGDYLFMVGTASDAIQLQQIVTLK